MITAMALGAGTGLGAWLVLLGWHPPRRPLAQVIAASRTPAPTPAVTAESTRDRPWQRLLVPAHQVLREAGWPTPAVHADLRVVGRNSDALLTTQLAGTAAGVLAPPLLAGLAALTGVTVPWPLLIVGMLAGGLAGFVVPRLRLRTEATAQRGRIRFALTAYLSLARLCLAGGAGIDEALDTAGKTGSGPEFFLLRRAVVTAGLTRTTPWAALRQLGEDLAVPALVDTAASIALAGTEGASVRSSIRAKTATLRATDLAEAEGHAHAATERMSLPVILLFGGFLVLITYPALAAVLGSL